MFPKAFELYQGLLTVDALVVLEGKLSIREEESPKLLVDRVTPLEDWKPGRAAYRAGAPRVPAPAAPAAPVYSDAQLAQMAKTKLYIRLARQDMPACTELLSRYPGSVPVYLHIPQEKVTLLCPLSGWADGSEACLKALTDKFGEANVKQVSR